MTIKARDPYPPSPLNPPIVKQKDNTPSLTMTSKEYEFWEKVFLLHIITETPNWSAKQADHSVLERRKRIITSTDGPYR